MAGSTGSGGSVTITGGKPATTGGTVTITGGHSLSTGSGGITLTGQSGKITLGTAQPTLQDAYAGTADNWSTVVGSSDMDQLRLDMFDLQQTVKLLMRQNQRLSDEVEALKAGVILDAPVLA